VGAELLVVLEQLDRLSLGRLLVGMEHGAVGLVHQLHVVGEPLCLLETALRLDLVVLRLVHDPARGDALPGPVTGTDPLLGEGAGTDDGDQGENAEWSGQRTSSGERGPRMHAHAHSGKQVALIAGVDGRFPMQWNCYETPRRKTTYPD